MTMNPRVWLILRTLSIDTDKQSASLYVHQHSGKQAQRENWVAQFGLPFFHWLTEPESEPGLRVAFSSEYEKGPQRATGFPFLDIPTRQEPGKIGNENCAKHAPVPEYWCT